MAEEESKEYADMANAELLRNLFCFSILATK